MKAVLGYNGGLDGYPAKFGSSHDAAASLVIDGVLVAACEEERFTREKHTGKFPRLAIEYVLREAGLTLADLDLVTYYWSYPLMFNNTIFAQNKSSVSLFERVALKSYTMAMRSYNKIANYSNERSRTIFEREMGFKLARDRYKVIPHHLCHTASSYYDSPFESALCLTLDAQGEATSSMAVHARGTNLDVIRETMVPNSLGFLYFFVSTFLGFDKHDEYKVMGLAPYGDPSKYRSFFDSIATNDPDGRYHVDQGLISRLVVRDSLFAPAKYYPSQMTKDLGPARHPDEPVTQRHMDIAASLQEALERVVLTDLKFLQKQTGEKNLCLAGGVALNCTMNGKIARSGIFEEVWVHPASHDGGTSAGAAFFGYYNTLKQPRPAIKRSEFKKKTFYIGPGFGDDSIESAVKEFDKKILHSSPTDLNKFVAEQLANGKVVGWYNGRMEWGPRALGNRSILADPRRDDMKDVVNHAIKLREGFRPFAPACLAEKVDEWFDMKGLPDSPYMLFIVPVHEDKRSRIPAVTHVDGSARVQTVTAQQNPRFHALLKEFHKQTGVPVLMNTSFNVKGEPIVNTPADAIRCFLGTQIDLLVMGDVVVEKRPEVVAEIIRKRQPMVTGRVVDGQISAI